QDARVDTLVLGCTHYPLLSGVLQLAMGDQVTLVSSAEETAKDLVRVLTEADLLRPHRSEEHTSELQSRFDLVCRLLLEQKKPESPVRPGIPSKGVRGCSYGAWRLSPPMHTAPSAAQMAAYLPAIAETTERYVTGTERAT